MNKEIKNWEDKSIPLVEAAKELKAAYEAYIKLTVIGVGRFHDYDRAWRDFVISIDRAWKKLKSEAYGRKKWKKIESEVERMRKKDSLLKYLVQARNVAEHSKDPLIQDWEPNLRVQNISGKLKFEFVKFDRPLLPVKNRGTIFNPPNEHFGKKLEHYRTKKNKPDAVLVAELAAHYYVDIMNKTLKEVFPQEVANCNSHGILVIGKQEEVLMHDYSKATTDSNTVSVQGIKKRN